MSGLIVALLLLLAALWGAPKVAPRVARYIVLHRKEKSQ